MGKDDISDRWAAKLGDNVAATTGDSDALRRAMQINPNAAIFAQTGATAAVKPGGGKRPIAEMLTTEKTKFQAERKVLKDEIARLQQNERSLVTKYLDKINAAILDQDPTLAQKATDDALRKEAAFLAEIGFQRAKLKDPNKTK